MILSIKCSSLRNGKQQLVYEHRVKISGTNIGAVLDSALSTLRLFYPDCVSFNFDIMP